jgi:hypothetical protein
MEPSTLIDAFMDVIDEKLDADEFEWLMLGDPKKRKGLGSAHDHLDLLTLGMRHWDDESSALRDLKASRALERLQGRYPELWAQVVMGVEAV